MPQRNYTPADRLLMGLDQALQTLFGQPHTTGRSNPASGHPEAELSDGERRQVARLMRINHTGEVCAQALYQGQALTAKLPQVRDSMAQAAQEENDHLAWCGHRLHELDNHKSFTNPLWFAGSFALGAAAGLAGDKWSLGFIVETEYQVCEHLQSHLEQLPAEDNKSRAILEQMKVDEMQHANQALEGGAAELPGPIRFAMQFSSKLMTRTVYWL